MAKITAWLMTLIGVLLVLAQLEWIELTTGAWVMWVIALAVLIIGITKLIRNYSYSK